MILRRNFLIGLTSMLAAPAIVRIENIMPVRALVEPTEQLIIGIEFQSWPWGTQPPGLDEVRGIIEGTVANAKGEPKPASHWLKEVPLHLYDSIVWRPITASEFYAR